MKTMKQIEARKNLAAKALIRTLCGIAGLCVVGLLVGGAWFAALCIASGLASSMLVFSDDEE